MKYKINDIVSVKVTGIEPYGVFVLLDNNIKGLLHISEISHDYVADISDIVKVNSIIKVKIIDILEDNRVRVSLKALQKKPRRRRFLKTNPNDNFSIGFDSLEKQLNIWIEKLEEEYER